MPTASHELENLFNPASIAIIGASAREGSIGFNLVQNLHLSGYEGEIFPVNHKYDEVLGHKCYHKLEDMPHHADLTLIAVPAAIVF